MNITDVLKILVDTKFKFVLIIILHGIFYGALCIYAPFARPLIIFSAAWLIGYLTAIRHFFLNPVDNFASKHVIYAQPNMYWVNYASRFVKNNVRIGFVSLIHVLMGGLPIFLHKKLSITVFGLIFISNAVLPITYLILLKNLYDSLEQKNK